MALEQAQAFLRKMQEEKELQKQVRAVEMDDSDRSFSLMAEIGKSAGFDFTPEEMGQAWKTYQENEPQRELNASELGTVTGGTLRSLSGPECR